MRALHDMYLDSIIEQFFINLPKVVKAIHKVLYSCSLMCRLLKEMSQEAVLDEQFQQKFWEIKSKFEV